MFTSVPDFLVIGAMKAGTTSLYRDLIGHPQIFLPEEKEPETLVRHGGDLRAVAGDYASLLGRARPGQLKGEASTAYAKRPDHEGVAEMARRVCGPLLKVIYITRDPIARIVSQYRHEFGLGEVTEDIGTAVLKYPRYVNYSRYDWQLEPWRSVFGEEQVMVLAFERYIAERVATVREVCGFLGVDPDLLPEVDPDQAFNANEGKLVPKGVWKGLVASRLYQRGIKPLVPHGLRQQVANQVLSPSAKNPSMMSEAVRAALANRLNAPPEGIETVAGEA